MRHNSKWGNKFSYSVAGRLASNRLSRGRKNWDSVTSLSRGDRGRRTGSAIAAGRTLTEEETKGGASEKLKETGLGDPGAASRASRVFPDLFTTRSMHFTPSVAKWCHALWWVSVITGCNQV
jgi:hypothetical protein